MLAIGMTAACGSDSGSGEAQSSTGAGAVVLAAPAVALFVVFQKRFTGAELSSGVKG